MQGVKPCLTFNDRAEEAINLYVSVLKNSKVLSIMRSDGKGPIPEGKLMHAELVLDGQEYTAFDGGPHFAFSEAFSFVATCDTQEEIDSLWTKLTQDGGEGGQCGWLKDRFGVSWQVIPGVLGEMLGDPVSGNSARAMDAMLKMQKLDIATLRRAYESS